MQEQDLATMAHDASKNAPPWHSSRGRSTDHCGAPRSIHLDCDIVVLAAAVQGWLRCAESPSTDET